MKPSDPLTAAVSRFGAALKAKLSGTVAGAPEDQLRAPFEALLHDLVGVLGFSAGRYAAVGEAPLAALGTRPDYAVTRGGALVGFVELKAPGKGADPRRFQDAHDRAQWDKLRALPNLLYSDGEAFSLWQDGVPKGEIVRLAGSAATAGAALAAPPGLLRLFSDFLTWNPIPPRTAVQLAEVSARLCRLLRDEVAEQMAQHSRALTDLATDWRKLLFPHASDEEFADGYAQAVTFGLLMARAQGIALAGGLDRVSRELGRTSTLIGSALRLLTDDVEHQAALQTSLATLARVLDAVEWSAIAKGSPEAWLYFYEDFLTVYDNELRKRTGSYYTPPEIVTAMVRLVDEVLRHPARFGVADGLASPAVTLADPAMGTGTFLLGVLRRIAEGKATDQGPGAVPAVIEDVLSRLIGFEMQFGPFAVAQVRLRAEIADLLRLKLDMPEDRARLEAVPLRLYVADTLGNPDEESEWIPQLLKPLAESRRAANRIKRAEPITVVIGNPPYKEKAKGHGGWVESGSVNAGAPLAAWLPPAAWGVGAHAKHLRNLYVYFWRWASWKVFGDGGAAPGARKGVVCFITVAGFLNGPGFQKMRADLRRDADEIFVIDCSPEGHQPDVATRVFQDVQQPVCIVLAVRLADCDPTQPARVRFRALPAGRREEKFAAISEVSLDGDGWIECAADWRAPFLPAASGDWATFPALDDFFDYDGSGVMPGRTWVIAPDADTLRTRWERLTSERDAKRQELLFHPHGSHGELGDRHARKLLSEGLQGHEYRPMSVAADNGPSITPVRYGFRSFDRQWIIPDNRLINRPNPTLWDWHSRKQVYLTAPHDRTPTGGPAVTFTCLIPDLHHYHGRGGRAFPLWSDADATVPNVSPEMIAKLSETLHRPIAAEAVLAYLAAIAAHPAYTSRFRADLLQPGLRIPLTADAALFAEAAALGREVIWLHTFGERFAAPRDGRPAAPPRLPTGKGPRAPADGAIPSTPEQMPDAIAYDAARRRLHVGAGHIDNVPPAVWAYDVSGRQVLAHWFSYRRRNRERPLIGTRRAPSPLGDIQRDRWLRDYTEELMNVLHVLGRLVALEPAQADLLARICAGPQLTAASRSAAASQAPPPARARALSAPSPRRHRQMHLFD